MLAIRFTTPMLPLFRPFSLRGALNGLGLRLGASGGNTKLAALHICAQPAKNNAVKLLPISFMTASSLAAVGSGGQLKQARPHFSASCLNNIASPFPTSLLLHLRNHLQSRRVSILALKQLSKRVFCQCPAHCRKCLKR